MMHLVSTCELPERPSDFEIACRILREVLRRDAHCNYLWTNGRWVHATVDDIMCRANEYRKRMGHSQFTGKPEWIAQ
jgi:hypothetical protein